MTPNEGADARFDRLYEAHLVAIVAYCGRRVQRDAVDDAVADVFLTAWRRIDEVPRGAELPWLYGVARNVLTNHRRGSFRRSRLRVRLTTQRHETTSDGPGAAGGDATVLAALAHLSDSDQEVLRLRAWEDLTSAEIALVLGINPAAVDARLSRARRRLERAVHSLERGDAAGRTFAGEVLP